ncbi:hypothetical protein [Metabacillus herbersteinensis]|uniref:hypothetical protein n=1 Tax=Metabacillus herbersteinensis TaxID=283816 RepID=UPI00366BACDA
MVHTIHHKPLTNFVSPTELHDIKTKISSLHIEDKKVKKIKEKNHKTEVQSKILLQKQKVSNGECPRCGNRLVSRKGKMVILMAAVGFQGVGIRVNSLYR